MSFGTPSPLWESRKPLIQGGAWHTGREGGSKNSILMCD